MIKMSTYNLHNLYTAKLIILGLLNLFCLWPFQTIARTKDNIVKKQALTYEEIEAEREEVRKQ